MLSALRKRLRTMRGKLMKNEHKRGKSARHGNAPAPYTKYGKVPYKYDMKEIEKTVRLAEQMGISYIQAREFRMKKNASNKNTQKRKVLVAAE